MGSYLRFSLPLLLEQILLTFGVSPLPGDLADNFESQPIQLSIYIWSPPPMIPAGTQKGTEEGGGGGSLLSPSLQAT